MILANSTRERAVAIGIAVASLVLIAVGLRFAATGFGRSNASLPGFASPQRNPLPPLILWAWERPEDLRFLSPSQDVGVAFLAGTIEIQPRGSENDDRGFVFRARRQPLRVQPGVPLIAVVRIESPSDLGRERRSVALSPLSADGGARRDQIVQIITNAARERGVRAVQIDFDASKSERSFYASLLSDVRAALPASTPLSVTALASWCIGDSWLDGLPDGTIDEAVPMLFRMGPDAAAVASFVRNGNAFRPAVCRTSAGLATDETFSQSILAGSVNRLAAHAGTRVYVFTDRNWTPETVARIERTWRHES